MLRIDSINWRRAHASKVWIEIKLSNVKLEFLRFSKLEGFLFLISTKIMNQNLIIVFLPPPYESNFVQNILKSCWECGVIEICPTRLKILKIDKNPVDFVNNFSEKNISDCYITRSNEPFLSDRQKYNNVFSCFSATLKALHQRHFLPIKMDELWQENIKFLASDNQS